MTLIRTLVADDHSSFRRTIISLLAFEHDFEVVGQAEDGIEAIQKALDLKPDLILMDMSMPHCDGLEATQRILEELPDVAVFILTAEPKDTRVVQALTYGARGYQEKNFKIDYLLKTLRNLMAIH